MEMSLLKSVQGTDLGCRDVWFFNSSRNMVVGSQKSKVVFGKKYVKWSKASIRHSVKVAAKSEAFVRDQNSDFVTPSRLKSKPVDGVKMYVGLPLDSVSACNSINHSKAISAGLKALKLLGVEGVELPIWWGVAEKEAMGKYEWSGYLALTELVRKSGLKLHVSLCFHASKDSDIPLPEWVSRIGESQPSIYFTDRSGQQYKECLSLGVDDLPVLDGKTPVQVYKEFCESFKASFAHFIGPTITGVSIGLGPNGELKYPSYHQSSRTISNLGAGEFQCYDQNMITHLKKRAEKLGKPLWGLSGPHDAPFYDQSPISNTTFFKEEGGSWETAYGDFFLSWYSSQLASHADRLLSLAAATFRDCDITVSGKVPLIHSWYKTRSHPSELTAGFYNTINRDGYMDIIGIFSKYSCKMIIPGLDLSDETQPKESRSSPELLISQLSNTCRKCGVAVSGQNLLVSGAPKNFEQIKKNLLGENGAVDLFTYQRMGAEFFSPKHFPSFTNFVTSLDQQELEADDVAVRDGETVKTLEGKDRQLQAV